MENEKREKRQEKEIYKPKKRIGDLGLEEQFAQLSTGSGRNYDERPNHEKNHHRNQRNNRNAVLQSLFRTKSWFTKKTRSSF